MIHNHTSEHRMRLSGYYYMYDCMFASRKNAFFKIMMKSTHAI